MTRYNSLTVHFFIQAGLKVFPCREGGPHVKQPYTVRGFKDATADMLSWKPWYARYPKALCGFPCAMNGTLVLDADRHGKGDGVANLIALFERHRFDVRTVPVVATPNNGFHFYFRRPDWLEATKSKLCEAVDIRDNAYVIAPGCALVDGRSYELVEGTLVDLATAIARGSIPHPPDWLIQMLVDPPTRPRSEAAEPMDEEAVRNRVTGILAALLNAQEGERNNYLHWAACRFADMILNDLISYLLAEMLLERAGKHLGLPAREVRSTIASALRSARKGDRHAC